MTLTRTYSFHSLGGAHVHVDFSFNAKSLRSASLRVRPGTRRDAESCGMAYFMGEPRETTSRAPRPQSKRATSGSAPRSRAQRAGPPRSPQPHLISRTPRTPVRPRPNPDARRPGPARSTSRPQLTVRADALHTVALAAGACTAGNARQLHTLWLFSSALHTMHRRLTTDV